MIQCEIMPQQTYVKPFHTSLPGVSLNMETRQRNQRKHFALAAPNAKPHQPTNEQQNTVYNYMQKAEEDAQQEGKHAGGQGELSTITSLIANCQSSKTKGNFKSL